ncbi:MAG: hypothetical protein FWC98_02395 [Bacteroidales bacterium]|nr:hypothetical protein [Bacteroidales bacterium]
MTAIIAVFIANIVQAQIRIAVLDFRAGAGVEQGDVDGISAIFSTHFVNPQKFTLVERTQIDRVIGEQGFQYSSLTNRDMVRLGQILNVQKIVVGDINIVGGQYNVDVRLVNAELGTIEAAEGATWARGASFRDLMRNLATRLMARIPEPVQDIPITPSPVAMPTAVVTLFDHLHVFSEDLGEFPTVPTNVIETINRNTMHGFNTWRVPTVEELALMRANGTRLGIRSGVEYMTSDGRRSGVVRLVTTGRTAVQQEAENARLLREGVYIAGVNWAIGNARGVNPLSMMAGVADSIVQEVMRSPEVQKGIKENRIALPSETGHYYDWRGAQYACPPGWRLPTAGEFGGLIRSGHTFAERNQRGNQFSGFFFGPNHARCSLPNNMDGCVFFPAMGWHDDRLIDVGRSGIYWSAGVTSSPNVSVLSFDRDHRLHESDRQPGLRTRFNVTQSRSRIEYSVRCVR